MSARKGREHLYAAAMAGIAAAAILAPSVAAHGQGKGEEQCWGINKCKAHSACGVGKSDIAATKEAFGEKFAKSATHDCAGDGKCAAAKGELSWVGVKEGTCISKEKGFLIVKEGDKKVVKK